jgi:molybdenum cofactor cytidylyltransferase
MTTSRGDTAQHEAASLVGGILLAAGASSRLGQPKQLLDFRGKPLVRHVAEQALASRLRHLLVVVGNQAAAVREALAGLEVQIVENPAYLQGQSTSLRAGLLAFPRELSAALVLLVDQPLVDAALIDHLIGLYEESRAPIVAPQFGGRRGNPVLFDRSIIPELLTVVGDTGAREIISRHRDRLATLELPDDRAFLDVDTWDDYRRVTGGTT